MKKKQLIIAVVLVAGFLAAYFIGQSRAVDKLLPEPQKASSAPKITYIPIAEAKGLEVEAEVVIEDWKRNILSAVVRVKNIESRELITAQLNTYRNQSKWIDLFFSVNHLKPGETAKLNLEALEIMNVSSIKSVELSFDPRNIFWERFTGPAAPAQPTKIEPQQPAETEKRVYTAADYPKNPKSPGEVMAAFIFLYNEKKFSEAEKLLTKEFLQNIQSKGGLKNLYNKTFQDRQIKEVKIADISLGTEEASGYVTVYYTDGTLDKESKIYFGKEDGKWKIDE